MILGYHSHLAELLLPNMGGTAVFGWGPDGPRGTSGGLGVSCGKLTIDTLASSSGMLKLQVPFKDQKNLFKF